MGIIKILCRDHVSHGRLFGWSSSKSITVAAELNTLFQQVAAGTDYTPVTAFSHDAPTAGDLVMHFLGSRGSSIIRRISGESAGTAAGATYPTSEGMVSEIYVQNISVVPGAIAKLAFHELMHNKLDAQTEPSARVVQDIHTHGGGGLATSQPIGENTPLTDDNIRLMRSALGLNIPQYSA